jgi:HSP20 family protein
MTQEPGRTASERYTVRAHNAWRPPTDVYETDGALVVKVEIPGVAEQDFEITITGRRLVIAGTRVDPASKLGYHNMEIRYGAFRTEIRMPWLPNEDAIEASYENGFLYVRLPKARRHQVQVR